MSPESSAQFVTRAEPITRMRAQEGESPLWDSAIGLRWLDTMGQQLFTLGLDGEERAIPLSLRATAIELGPTPRLLAVTSTGFG